jgi:integrase
MPSTGKPPPKQKVVRRRLADGTFKEYRYEAKRQVEDEIAPGSLEAVIQAYKRSPKWLSLRPASKYQYDLYSRSLKGFLPLPMAGISRQGIVGVRNAIASERGVGAANMFMTTCKAIWSWALEDGHIQYSVLAGVRTLQMGHFPAWTEAEADFAEANFPAPLARAILLARYTGQRRGDLISMTWRAYDGQAIEVEQEKGSTRHPKPPLRIPVHPRLKAELDAWKREATSTHILVSSVGRPWHRDSLSSAMADVVNRLQMRTGLNIHGLRKLAAACLADAGCSTHEIAAITGHATLAMVQLYTRSADQHRLANAAISRLKKRG